LCRRARGAGRRPAVIPPAGDGSDHRNERRQVIQTRKTHP